MLSIGVNKKQTHPKVDEFFSKAKNWKAEMAALRAIVHTFPLEETFKWWQPVYAYNNKNVLIISAFKDCCVLSFFKGALLQDPEQVLVQPGPNSRIVRMFKFTNLETIEKLSPTIHAYIQEAIELEKAGKKVELPKEGGFEMVQELKEVLQNNPALKTAFEALTPGRQRAYNLHFSAPKQAKTRISRIEKCAEKILSGKGFQE